MTVSAAAADGYRTNATSSIDRVIRLSTAAAALAVAGITAYVSYWHAVSGDRRARTRASRAAGLLRR